MLHLFDASPFVPRWACGNWPAWLGWLFIASDVAIWLAYLGIPVLLVVIARRRPDLPFRRLFWMFGLFIVGCGTTHLLDAVMFYWPGYGVAGLARVVTAAASWGTLLLLLPAVPHILRLRPGEELEREVTERRKAEDALRRANDTLAARVAARTADLEKANAELERTSGLLRAVAEEVPVALYVKDRAGRYLLFNPAAGRFVGRRPEEVIGLTDADLFDPAGAAVIAARDRRVMETGAAETEEEVLTAAGVTRVYLATKAAYRDPAGRVIGVLGVSRDVTDRKRDDEARRAEAERFEKLAAVAPGVLHSYRLRPGGAADFPYASPTAAALLGLGPADLAAFAARPADFLHPDDVPGVAEAVAASARDLAPFAAEYRLRHPARGEVWVECRSAPVREPDGTLVWHGFLTDVTARKRAEEELRASEGRFRAVVEAALDCVIAIDRGGRVVEFNPAAERTFGYARAEVVGRDLAGLIIPAGARAAHDAGIARFLATGESRILNQRLVGLPALRKDGTEFPAELTVVPMGPPADPVFVAFLRDITDQKRAEDDLRRSEKRYRSLVSATTQTVWTAGPGGGLTSIDGGAEFIPDPADRASPPAWEAITHHDDRGRVADAWRAALAREEPFEVEYRLRRADGEWRQVAVRAVPVPDGAGRVEEWVGLTEDVTDRRRLEDQYRQGQKMEAVGRLAGGVAHDFNNLLTVINGNAELVLEFLRPDDPARALVEDVRRAGDRSAGLTRQLLAFSRREVVAPRVLDPNAVVRDLERMLRRVIGEDVRLEAALCPDAGHVRADRGQLEQAVLNLVVNARDAMPTGGTLTVATRAAEVNGRPLPGAPAVPPGGYVVLTVRDTGCGMTDEVRARVFEPFYTTKGVGQGTGLGLAVVHGVAERAGGGVAVESAPGAGSAFHVYLPRVNDPTPPPKSRSALLEAPRGTETVLLVEDEAAVRTLSRAVLEGAGYTVVEAVDGADVDRALAEHGGPVDLVVTDVVMPGASGPAVAARVREAYPGARVLFVSGYTDDSVVRHGVERAAVDFLQKPFTPGVLAHTVRAVLDRPAAVPAGV
ncbi:MAG: PAS domain S-box protein [Gemmataceae bacterium]|nr:PAS domain S-box protein [Gemmataceae bacterium]